MSVPTAESDIVTSATDSMDRCVVVLGSAMSRRGDCGSKARQACCGRMFGSENMPISVSSVVKAIDRSRFSRGSRRFQPQGGESASESWSESESCGSIDACGDDGRTDDVGRDGTVGTVLFARLGGRQSSRAKRFGDDIGFGRFGGTSMIELCEDATLPSE